MSRELHRWLCGKGFLSPPGHIQGRIPRSRAIRPLCETHGYVHVGDGPRLPADSLWRVFKDLTARAFGIRYMFFGEEGVWGLYRGFVAVAVGGTPGTCIYLTTYEVAKNMLEADAGTGQFGVHFTAGMVAETICCVVYVPVDVVKERLQVQRSASSTGGLPQYTGTRNALGSILRTEGLWGIYKGYGATLASFGPFSALYFTFYEQAKATSQQLWGAGSLASWITSPLDMAKLRLQVQRASSSAAVTADTTHQYTGMANVLARTYRLEGVRGLFRGAGARVWFHAPSTAITMATFEQAKRWWGALLGPQPGN